MIRTWKFNAILGLMAFILTFWLSIYNNTWETALFRACIGFLLFFIWGFGIRLILHSPWLSEQRVPNKPNMEMEKKEESELLEDEDSFHAVSLGSLHGTEASMDFEQKL